MQGLADSDGYVHFENQEVHLIVSPNVELVSRILISIGIHHTSGVNKGLDILKISIKDAYRLPIFSPRVKSYRFKLVQRLASAKRLNRGPWPTWLSSQVDGLVAGKHSTRGIMLDILDRHNLLVRASNVRRHARKFRLES